MDIAESFDAGASGFSFVGLTPKRRTLSFNGQTITECYFENFQLTGTNAGQFNKYQNCEMTAASFQGNDIIDNCIFRAGTIIFGLFVAVKCCVFDDSDIDAAGIASNVSLDQCSGKITIKNVTSGDTITIRGFHGDILIASTCTGGTITILDGSGRLTDNSGGTSVTVEAFIVDNDNKIFMDTGSGNGGTNYPVGTAQKPSNDIDNAVTIANARSASSISVIVRSSHQFDAGAAYKRFIGSGNTLWPLDLNGQVVSYCYFEKIYIQGACASVSQNTFFLCQISGWTGKQGDLFISCQLAGTLQPYAKEKFVNCGFGISGNAIFDFNTNWQSGPEYLNIQGCHGSITLRNLTIDSNIMIEGFKGDITIDATCTAGTINIRGGSGRLNDNSAGTTVNVDGFFEGEEVADLTALLAQVNDIKSIVSKGHYQGVSWYVDPGAVSGNNTGVSWEDAFLTGEAAMAIAQWGDYIFIRVSNSPDSGSREFDEDWNVPKGVTVIGCPGATDYLYRNSNIRLAGNSSYPAQPILTLNEGARIERIRVEARVDTKDNINLIEMRRFSVMRRCTIGDIIFASIQSNILCVKEDFARIEHVRFELNNLYTGKYAIVIEGNRSWLKDCDFSGTQNNDIIHINGGNYSHVEGNAFQGIGAGYAAIRITTGVGSNINTNAWSKEVAGSTAKFLNDVGGSETLDFNNNEYATRVTQRDMENIMGSAGNTGRRLLKISSEYYEVVPYDNAAGAYTHRRRKLRSGDSIPGTPITVIPANSIQHFGDWADCNSDGTT
jgi:hypothetical protein